MDISALNLIKHCKEWTESLASPIKFSKLELVPAPKASKWEFIDNDKKANFNNLLFDVEKTDFDPLWRPKTNQDENESTVSLRPLAHISIREQSMMTLLMMGLANEVETMQGNPETSLEEVHAKGIVSYGNRLYCQYSEGGLAKHSYGATTTYSKYFVDYRNFLNRPYHFATEKLGEISPDERVYLVELDLSKFFDLIKRDVLIEKINLLAKLEHGNDKYQCLDNLLSAFEKWKWSEGAANSYKELCCSNKVPEAPNGLPQGLVAAGFLSNVYMLEFDEKLKEKIGDTFSDDSIRLVDYCRYVDDVRLVLVGPAPSKLSLMEIKERVIEFIEGEPCWSKLNLHLNDEKTRVEVFHGRKVGVSNVLEEIQHRLSGPISLDEAENQLGQLENLLSISNDNPLSNMREGFEVNLLAHVESARFDVREDTLKRFAANKLTKILNEIRHFTTQQPDESGNLQPGSWDYLQERIARRFIACWSYDPSLVLLLKKGVEIFPSTKLLVPVLQQLDSVIARNSNPKEVAVAEYCLSEIYRHSAIVIHKKDRLAIPAQANVDDFFELLQDSAAQCCGRKEYGKFDLLSEQACFLLLVRGDTKLDSEFADLRYSLIDKLIRGFRNIPVAKSIKEQDIASAILMANQISNASKECIRATSCLLEAQNNKLKIDDVFKFITIQDKTFATSLIRHARGVKQLWCDDDEVKRIVKSLHLDIKPLAMPLDKIEKEVSLLRLVMRDDNPFANEIMALLLMKATLNDENINLLRENIGKPIDLASTKVQFNRFSNIVGYV
ncbi:hypothetical protein GCM10022421_32930 [Oceanisphaera sediminis]|uniref:Reverse transcriptase domain-containing protein n=1 Tax=Oceanisphaera sediminis TaxID=981381 RepID=A0ABP7EQX5_9GAMM